MTQFDLRPILPRVAALVTLTLMSCGSQDGVQSGSAGAICAHCVVEMEDVLELRAPVESEPTLSSRVVRNSRGRFYVSPLVDASTIAVFDEDGSYVTTLGRRGEGPGEFIEIRDVAIGPGDSLHVLHDSRITIYSPEHEYVRSLPSEEARMSGYIAVTSEGIPITARNVSTYGAGEQELVWRHTAEGPVAAGITSSSEAVTARDVTVAGDTISLLLSDYSVHFSAPGAVWQRRGSAPAWYEEELTAAAEGGRRAPFVAAVMPRGDSIWVLSYQFGPRPLRPTEPQAAHAAPRALSASEFQGYSQPRVDVWTRSGELIASVQLAGSMRFVDAAHISEVVEDSLFNHAVMIRRFGLRRDEGLQ
jgi:hypothetical protein